MCCRVLGWNYEQSLNESVDKLKKLLNDNGNLVICEAYLSQIGQNEDKINLGFWNNFKEGTITSFKINNSTTMYRVFLLNNTIRSGLQFK